MRLFLFVSRLGPILKADRVGFTPIQTTTDNLET
jgi:hypothetical protein